MSEADFSQVPDMPLELREAIAQAVKVIEIHDYLIAQGYEDAAEQLALDFSMRCPCDCGYRADEHDQGRYEAIVLEKLADALDFDGTDDGV